MPKKTSRTETAERVSVLIRIFRSALRSGDVQLRNVTAAELKEYGIEISLLDSVDLANASHPSIGTQKPKGGAQ